MPDFLFTPAPNDAAQRFLREKPAVSRGVFDRLLPELRARAFAVSGIESIAVLRKLRDRVSDLPAGADWDEVKRDLAADMADSLGEEGASRRAELLLRTHGYQVYAVGHYETLREQQAVFPYWEYDSANDAQVRDTHRALDGKILPASSAFWKTHFPPWEFGCRCNVIARSADDVADIEAADARKVPEARRVLKGEVLARAERGVLLTEDNGVPRQLDIRAPREKFGGSGYSFDPSSLQLSLDDLRARYADQPDTWGTFETWARETAIPEQDRTVWDWLGGSTRPDLRSGPAVAAAPATPPAGAEAPVQPVSAALEVRARGAHGAQIRTTLRAIDQVHDDGLLPHIPVQGSVGRVRALGYYQHTRAGRPILIAIKAARDNWPAMTTAHEVGHFLDHQVLGAAGAWASEAHPALEEFRSVVAQTAAVRQIAALPSYVRGDFLQPIEIWARSYAQYIATRSRDPLLLEQLDKIRTGSQPWRQWSDEDFQPVAAAIDSLFRAKGWLRT